MFQEDVTTRLRGLKSLFRVLKSSTSLEFLQGHIAQILQLLFSASDQPALRLLAQVYMHIATNLHFINFWYLQENLSFLFENVDSSILQSKISQIPMFLSKMGMPDGVRLAMKLVRQVSVAVFIDQLLSKPILHAKSSKVNVMQYSFFYVVTETTLQIREGSIQILIGVCRLCPSTDIEVAKVAKAVVGSLVDKKRKVRQAALELLAVLAQLGSINLLLDIATGETQDHPERERILRALRNRYTHFLMHWLRLNKT